MRTIPWSVSRTLLAVTLIASIGLPIVGEAAEAVGQEEDVEETADDLESAIDDLQDALDDIETHRGLSDDIELSDAQDSVRYAKKTMRLVATRLLLASVEHARPGDLDRVLRALKIIAPDVFDRPPRD